jgi:hypothetical protein
MERFTEIIRAVLAAMQTAVRTVMRPVLIAGRWTLSAVQEVVTLPVKAAAVILSPLGRLFGPRGAAAGQQAQAAAAEASREIREAKNETDGTDELRDVAKRLQRAAAYKSRGHETAEGIIAELPTDLARWVRHLSTGECAALGALDPVHVCDHLRDRRPTLPGVRTFAEILAEQRAAAAPPVPEAAPARTDAEQAVMDRLAERLIARGRAARTSADADAAYAIH